MIIHNIINICINILNNLFKKNLQNVHKLPLLKNAPTLNTKFPHRKISLVSATRGHRKESKMKVLDRFKLELSNQPYFSDEEYIQFLQENYLDPDEEYRKDVMQRDLYQAVIDTLDAVCNDINIMRSISTSFGTIGQAYEYIEARIAQLNDKMAAIPMPYEDRSCFSMMFTRGHQRGTVAPIPIENIENLE